MDSDAVWYRSGWNFTSAFFCALHANRGRSPLISGTLVQIDQHTRSLACPHAVPTCLLRNLFAGSQSNQRKAVLFHPPKHWGKCISTPSPACAAWQ